MTSWSITNIAWLRGWHFKFLGNQETKRLWNQLSKCFSKYLRYVLNNFPTLYWVSHKHGFGRFQQLPEIIKITVHAFFVRQTRRKESCQTISEFFLIPSMRKHEEQLIVATCKEFFFWKCSWSKIRFILQHSKSGCYMRILQI